MKNKVLFLIVITGLISFISNAQRGARIGYIDTEYILQNVPEYQQATSQLEKKAQKWKSEIEQRLSVIDQQKKQLENESVLLTKELYEERLEDITFEEAEVFDYQQKRFGPSGDLMTQKEQLIQPIQDQIFSAVQEIANNKKYDFIFDKSADVVMLFSAKRFNISEIVLRSITRASKRTQAQSKAERKKAEKEEVVPVINNELDARKKALEDKKAERAKAIEARKQKQLELREAKKKEVEDRRNKILEDRKKLKEERANAKNKTSEKSDDDVKDDSKEEEDGNVKETEGRRTAQQILEERKQQKLKEREARKKALEERKKKILEARKKQKEEREKGKKITDSLDGDN